MRTGRMTAIAIAIAAGAVGTGVTYAVTEAGHEGGTTAPNPATAARTSLPGLIAATAGPTLTGLNAATPRPGTVVRVSGPFDDRFTMQKLVFDGSKVSGRVLVTSDVSDILEFEALAGFYDPRGRLLGTNRFVHHLVEESHGHTGPPSELQTFTIAVPKALQDRAVSAAVGVPVLVNE